MVSNTDLKFEEALVIKYQTTGCNLAFGKLYEIFYSSLFDYTCKIVKNCDDAFDVTQDTFITAAKELHKLRQPITFRFWLFRIAKHNCLSKFRNNSKMSADSYEDDFLAVDYSTEEALEKEDQLLKLETIIADLTDEERSLIHQKYNEGKSIKQIMTENSLGSSAVKMKLLRARTKIASKMTKVS